jgi:pimeloyl-ACP methyl ester carboxylesterase
MKVEGNGPPLVLMHGLLGSSFCWRHNTGPLARHFRVYTPDLPLVSMAEGAGRLAEFMRSAGLSKASFMGASAGGQSVMLLASRHPEMVDRMVLVAPVNLFSQYGRRRIRFGGTRGGQILLRIGQQMGPQLVSFILRRRLYASASRVSAETVSGYARAFKDKDLPAELSRVFKLWETPAMPPSGHRTLLVWGDKDRMVSLASGRALAKAWNAQLEVIPDCGHLVFEEDPDSFNRKVLGFLIC